MEYQHQTKNPKKKPTHTQTYTHVHTLITHSNTCTHTRTHECTDTHTHAHTHTRTHARTHTYRHKHTQIICKFLPVNGGERAEDEDRREVPHTTGGLGLKENNSGVPKQLVVRVPYTTAERKQST